jgi:class 3 adenylate cyclase/tetratricopeptide (TPR) repeat protein
VSVLFADLVGFTTLSESRDPEEVRELLSRYFETSRQLIARYGGTVEKFIGDAVMAVWGTPIAREDDAERAVRAALDLTSGVAALGQEVGASDLRARAGVLTGEAAVTIGAEGQGMVAGDLVNTASRIQSVAPPGAVYVGEVTRRASEGGVAYEDAGSHELKGKAEAVPLWRALRVVGGIGGSLRTEGLEAPFVGRDREMRLIKEMFHASSEEKRAHLVSVMGIAGIGKSRLSWEFEKYVDGLAQDTWWHRGRCLAYGEGVAYWALAEMVRMRARIVEGEDDVSALAKLRTILEELVPDVEERRWVEPRLAHLIGLEERTARDQVDLFSAWRVFFERMAQIDATAMVFEDLQWADAALLDFIEYMLLTLSRPELSDRRPNWGAGKRNFTSLFLEPLSAESMEELMRGLVPGLLEEIRTRILERAEGIPLYAVETVRMLLDRGLLVKEDGEFRPVGRVEDLEVPETLHALIAARLDGLSQEERRLLQDASVLGKTFTKQGLAALMSVQEDGLDALLTSLVRKEFLSLQADPRSPERGQYGFLQDLVKRVAYETLSKRERKARHLAAAHYLEASSGYDEDEIVEVLSSHYVEAYRADADAADAQEIKDKAREKLVRAGEHASSLAASEQAQHYFEQAAELADDPVRRAELLEQAALMAYAAAKTSEASDRFEQAIALFEQQGRSHPAARVSARVAQIMWETGRMGDAIDRMDKAYSVLSAEEPDEALAEIAHQLGRLWFFSGQGEKAAEPIELALDIAEALWLPEVLSQALNTKGVILSARGRNKEGLALMRYSLEVAIENDLGAAALRAYFNLADAAGRSDRYLEARQHVEDGMDLARRLGNRFWEWQMLGQAYSLLALGQWDELLAWEESLPPEAVSESRNAFQAFLFFLPFIHVHRGELDKANEGLQVLPDAGTSADIQEAASLALGRAAVLRAENRFAEALDTALEAFSIHEEIGIASEIAKEAIPEAAESALALGDLTRLESLIQTIEDIPKGKLPQALYAHALRLRGRLHARHGEGDAESFFKGAAGLFRELSIPFWMAVTLLEHGEWLVEQDRAPEAQALLDEAQGIFERLKARPWLDRLGSVEGYQVEAQAGS